MSQWIAHRADHGATVMPLNDAVVHDNDEDCACGPTWEPIAQLCGEVDWLLIHHSLDGRETRE